MSLSLKLGLFASLLLVFLVLVAGVLNLLSRSSLQASRSNILMRWRVGLQFVAILMLIVAGWLWSQ